MNAIVFGRIRGRGQKSTAYSEDISVMEFYLPALTLHLLWSILFIFCLLAPEGMNLLYTMIAGDIILSSLTASRRQYQNKPQPSVPFPISLLKDYCIHFFCVLAPHGMNSIVFGQDKGEKSEVFCLLKRYIATTFFYILFCKSMSTNITPILF